MPNKNLSNTPIPADITGEPTALDFISDVEILPEPRERSFWEMLLHLPDPGSALLEEAQQAALLDKYKASLTYSTIQSVTAYSVMESQLASTSPRGAARIGALIDAYTVQAVKTIQGR